MAEAKSPPATRPIAYSRLEFWKAYSHLFFCAPDNAGLRETAARLAAALPEDKDRPVEVLCLGVGAATFEFPLLSAMQRALPRRAFKVTAVDRAWQPLTAAGSSLRNLSKISFRDSTEYSRHLEKAGNWTASKPASETLNQDRLFDLDLDRYGNGSHPWKADYPSQWAQCSPGPGDRKYDLIIAAFCLHHLDWGRTTLARALTLLRPKGTFLLSQVDGDVNFFDRTPPPAWLTRHPAGPNRMIQELLSEFFSPAPEKSQHLVPRQNSAMMPWAFLDLLGRLPLECLEHEVAPEPELAYVIENNFSIDDAKLLLETRGFSPLRQFEDALGGPSSGEYNELLKKTLAKVGSPPVEKVRNRLRWHAFRNSLSGKLASDPLLAKFTRIHGDMRPGFARTNGAKDSERVRLFEYELTEAANLGLQTSVAGRTADAAPTANLIRQLCQTGVLHDSALVGVVGPGFVRAAAFHNSISFVNPLAAESDVGAVAPRLALYLAFRSVRKAKKMREFSNAHVLLNEILPLFPVPVVFTYHRQPVSAKYRGKIFDVEFNRYRSFIEMRFNFFLGENFQKRVPGCEDAWRRALTAVKLALKPKRFPTVEGQPSYAFGMVQPTGRDFADAVNQYAESIDAAPGFGFEESLAYLSEVVGQRSSLFLSNPNHVGLLKNALAKEMVETLYWLASIQPWQTVAIYPVTYASTKPGIAVEADDALIMFYGETLDPNTLRHEYRKFSIVYDRAAMRLARRRSEEGGRLEAIEMFGHQVKAVVSAMTDSWMLSKSQIRVLRNSFEKSEMVRLEAAIKCGFVVPLPELFAWGLEAVKLWSHRLAAKQLFPSEEKRPATLEGLVAAAWRLAVHLQSVVNCRSILFDRDPTDFGDAEREVTRAKRLEARVPRFELAPGFPSVLVWERIAVGKKEEEVEPVEQITRLLQLFGALFDEYLTHGDKRKLPSLRVRADNLPEAYLVEFSNVALSDTESAPRSSLQPGFHGHEVIVNLVEDKLFWDVVLNPHQMRRANITRGEFTWRFRVKDISQLDCLI